MVRTTGFESFSMIILDCWSIINSIVNDDVLIFAGCGLVAVRGILFVSRTSQVTRWHFGQINKLVSSDHIQ